MSRECRVLIPFGKASGIYWDVLQLDYYYEGRLTSSFLWIGCPRCERNAPLKIIDVGNDTGKFRFGCSLTDCGFDSFLPYSPRIDVGISIRGCSPDNVRDWLLCWMPRKYEYDDVEVDVQWK